MKQVFLSFILVLVGTVAAHASQKSMTCNMKGIEEPVSFLIPNKMGDLPNIDFAYPVNVTTFSLRSNNLLLVAMDKEDTTRPRVFLSAQLQKRALAYTGQFMTDSGGNQLQLDNGPVSCTLK